MGKGIGAGLLAEKGGKDKNGGCGGRQAAGMAACNRLRPFRSPPFLLKNSTNFKFGWSRHIPIQIWLLKQSLDSSLNFTRNLGKNLVQ